MAPVNPKPQILLIQRLLPPYRLPFFLRLTASVDFDVTLAYGQASAKSGLESIANPNGVRSVPLQNIYYGKNERAVVQKGFLSLLSSRNYQVVIVEFNPRILSTFLSLILKNSMDYRLIWWGHGLSPRSTPMKTKIRLMMTQRADAIIFYDALQAEQFISRGIPKDKVFVAPNCIDVDEIAALAQPWKESHRYRLLCIGRLIPEKKTDLLILAFSQAYPHLPPETKLTIIGDGPEKDRLVQLTASLGLTRQVEFTGAIYEQAILAPWFNSALVSAAPGYVGLNVLHSLAYGLPFVAALGEPHSPEIAAIEDGVNALFFPANDIQGLANCLIKIGTNQTLCEKLSQAAVQTIKERYSLKSMVTAFAQAIHYVMRT